MIDFESAQIKVNVLFFHKNIQIKKKTGFVRTAFTKAILT